MTDLGVKIETGRALSANSPNGLTLSLLKEKGYECAFIGIGKNLLKL